MGKRFTDTEKYKKPFIRSLKGAYKLLWDYICLDCNHAGIWIVDFEVAQLYIGNDMQVNKKEALECFNKSEERVIPFDNGTKWFIKSFVEFQYGTLSEKIRSHKSVIDILEKNKLINFVVCGKGLANPLSTPLQGCKDKDTYKDKDKEYLGESAERGGITFPKILDTQDFIKAFARWENYCMENRISYLGEIRTSTLITLKNLAKAKGVEAAIGAMNNGINKKLKYPCEPFESAKPRENVNAAEPKFEEF